MAEAESGRSPRSLPEPMTDRDVTALDSKKCVICLETVSERVVACPCQHDCFDFPCLGSWLTSKRTCPMCKGEVEKLEYGLDGSSESKIFELLSNPQPDQGLHNGPTDQIGQCRSPRWWLRRSPRDLDRQSSTGADGDGYDPGLERRRQVYRHQLLSLHVGTNRISKYREWKPRHFRHNELLQSKARKWIRRELQVFEFLDLDYDHVPGTKRRRATCNAEFVLEYVIAVLKVTDIRASGGEAEELLKDFLGRSNTKVFLHELHAWLRSPYHHLRDWDDAVQYKDDICASRCSTPFSVG